MPIVKWLGGKRQLINEINEVLPKTYKTYFEPFVGGGTVLFDIQPSKAIINDLNKELINTYKVIKENVSDLIKDLSKHKTILNIFTD